MIVQVRAISQKTTQQAELLFKERAAQLRERVGQKLVDAIVDGSPIDTGTYIMAHVAGAGESGESAGRSSKGKIRGRNPAQFRNLARGNLRRSVSAAAISASAEIWFRNRAEHAGHVEYLGWAGTQAYHVYANARAMAPQFIRDAALELGMTTR